MVPIRGEALMVLGVLWSLTAVTFVFVLLRVYTRLKVLDAYGTDDHFFNVAFVMLVIYSVCISISATHGFGQEMADIPTKDDITTAILWEATGQTFVVFAVWVSKSSLAFFLFRLAATRKQKIAIMIPNVVLCLSVTAALLLFWFSCQPIAFLWDRTIVGGTCLAKETTSVSLLAGSLSIFTDFFYASFPWYLLWGVPMPPREKLLIRLSLSLGVLAGICGIERAVQIHTLASTEYLRETAPLIIWHAAELSTTMVCIGIPVCRPLFKRWYSQISSGSEDSELGVFRNHAAGVYTVHTIGGSKFTGPNAASSDETQKTELSRAKRYKSAARNGHVAERPVGGNASDESILGLEY